MPYQSFEKLEVWQRSCQQAVNVLDIVEKFTNFALKDQMSRSAISVPSNIAEGHGRNSNGDFARFLNIAQGSNGELRTQLYIAQKKNFIDSESAKQLTHENIEISNMIHGLKRSIGSQ